MSQRIIIDLRLPLRNFTRALSHRVNIIPEYVISEVVLFVFDVLIYELENHHEEPDLTRLGNFYRDELERDPIFQQMFLESFFGLLREVCNELRSHGLYTGDGFEFHPERNNSKNRSIVVKKFHPD
jgi:hypothetical protein